MKIAKVIKDNEETFGIIRGEFFFEVTSNSKNKISDIQELNTLINQKISKSSERILEIDSLLNSRGDHLNSIKLLPPITEKNKIICVGINYPKLYKGILTKKPDHIQVITVFHF